MSETEVLISPPCSASVFSLLVLSCYWQSPLTLLHSSETLLSSLIFLFPIYIQYLLFSLPPNLIALPSTNSIKICSFLPFSSMKPLVILHLDCCNLSLPAHLTFGSQSFLLSKLFTFLITSCPSNTCFLLDPEAPGPHFQSLPWLGLSLPSAFCCLGSTILCCQRVSWSLKWLCSGHLEHFEVSLELLPCGDILLVVLNALLGSINLCYVNTLHILQNLSFWSSFTN